MSRASSPPGPLVRLRRLLAGIVCLAATLGTFLPSAAQEVLSVPELDAAYRVAESYYELAFRQLENLSARFERVSSALSAAITEGDEAEQADLYIEQFDIGQELRGEQRRVSEKAQELRDARAAYLDGLAVELEHAMELAAVTTDSTARAALQNTVGNTRSKMEELYEMEDPPETLEPLPEMNAEPRDGPVELRYKADVLELRATMYEEQRAYNDRRLESLRRDQRLLRMADDFVAGINLFDDATSPVRAGASRNDPPPDAARAGAAADSLAAEGVPLTLEQRIAGLELLQEAITEAIQTIRVRAVTLRRLAGGEWAW